MGFDRMTEVQASCIPALLTGRDVLGAARIRVGGRDQPVLVQRRREARLAFAYAVHRRVSHRVVSSRGAYFIRAEPNVKRVALRALRS